MPYGTYSLEERVVHVYKTLTSNAWYVKVRKLLNLKSSSRRGLEDKWQML